MTVRALILISLLPLAHAEDEERTRAVYHFAELKPAGQAEAALRIYNEWGGGPGDEIPPDVMQRMYEAAGQGETAFKTMAALIDKGLEPGQVEDASLKTLRIDEAHSRQMAQIRERMIEGVIEDILKEKGGEWKLGRSDSGNPDSGMKSDLDQTFYVLKKGPHGQWVRDLDADRAFIEMFHARWKKKHPRLSVQALDIASIEGKQRFPDPRDVHLNFEAKFLETIDTLRRTPGAYTFSGAVAQQMQFRALSAVLGGVPRAFMEYEVGPDGTMRKLPFDPDYAQRILFGIEPALIPAHAYGAAVANFLTLQHYMKKPKFETKYHLRVWEDCGHILAMPEKLKEGKVEYLDLDADERARLNERIVDPMFDDPKARELHKLALDVSADLRLIHKGKLEKVFGSDVPEPAARDAVVFDKLARAMFGDAVKGAPTPEQVRAAVSEHRRLASEFCLESVYRSAVEAFKVTRDPHFKQPLDVEGYRHLMRGVPEADWPKARKNLHFAARMTLLYSLYDLGWYKSGELLLRLHREFKDVGLAELGKLWAEGRVQALAAPLRNQKLREAMLNDLHRRLSLEIDLDDFTSRAMRKRVGDLNERVQRRVLAELGFKDVEAARMVGHFLNTKKLSWSPAKFARNMVWDPGSIDALAQIVRAYVTSEGDMEHVQAVALNELVLAVPVAGQLVSLSRGGVQGLVLMAGAIQFPPFGVALIVYSVGEAGYAIYDAEYARHAENNVVDAIYRGFSGPATRAYDSPPPAFEESDAHLLKVLGTRLERAIEAKNEAEAKELAPRVRELEIKKERWKTFRDGSWAGGYFTEWGAQKEQKPILVSLLQDVPPIVSYSPMGIIDFRADHRPGRDNPRIAELEKTLKTTRDAEEYVRAAHELDELQLQKDRWERAQRYLRAAMGDDAPGVLSEREKRSGVPELLFKIRRDSLYPALLERAVRLKDEKGNLSTPNPDTFVDDWIRAVGDWAVRELNDKGVLSGGDVSDLPVDELKDRLTKDYERSRTIWKEFRRQEEVRKEQAEIRLRQRIEAYRAEAAGMMIDEIDGLVPEFGELTAAMLLQAVRRRAPVVEADVLVLRAKGRDGELAPQAEVRVQVRVKADPHLYRGPYPSILHRLDRAAARAAVSGGSLGDGIPVLPATKRALELLLAEAGDAETMIPVVSVFATAMPDLSRALPGTVDHLPRQQTSHGILMGQAVPAGRSEPDPEPEPEPEPEPAAAGPARIMMACPRESTPAERMRGLVEYDWKDPTPALCTWLVYNDRERGARTAAPYLWIEWPDLPKDMRLVLDWKVHGGIPRIDIAPQRSGIGHLAKDEFGLARDRGRGNRFTLEIPLGHSHYSAGTFVAEGRLMAFDPKRRDWKTGNPDQALPFRASVDYVPPPLEASGTSSVNAFGHAHGSIAVKNAQPGRRVAKITTGGTTWHDMFSGGANFQAPGAGSAPVSATISFRNYGRDVSLTVPLKTGKAPERAVPRTGELEKTLGEIAKLKARNDAKWDFDILKQYTFCQMMYTPTSDHVVEVVPWLEYTEKVLELHEALLENMTSPAWPGWAGCDFSYEGKFMSEVVKGPQAADGIAEARSRYGQWLANRYNEAMRCAEVLGRMDLLDGWLRRAEEHARRTREEPKYAPECWRTVARGYRMKAKMVFHARGGFDTPNALTEKANVCARKANRIKGVEHKDYPFHYKPDPDFDPGDR